MITFSQLGKYGAMGNQLFQYAALFGISKKTGFKMKIPPVRNDSTGGIILHGNRDDGSPIETYEYSLGCYMITSGSLLPSDFAPTHKSIIKRLMSKCRDSLTDSRIRFKYREPYFHFNPEIFNIRDGTDILGYVQSEKYFMHCADEIRNEFKIKEIFSSQAKKKMASFSNDSRQNISIHIRRVGHEKPEFQNRHPLVPISFYNEAMQLFREKLDNPFFMVFSDDIPWCKKYLISNDLIYIENNPAIVDLSMMIMCDHHVIANSSFSWWGAWLNPKQEKIVIAPKLWFSDKKMNSQTKDLVPENWIRI